MSSLTVQLTLLQDSYNECIYWMKENQPELQRLLELPDSINIIDLSDDNMLDNEEGYNGEAPLF